jgi:Putative adhesin
VKRLALSIPLAALVACSSSAPTVYATTVGVLQRGASIGVTIDNGVLNAFRPAQGDPADRFTVTASAYGAASPPPAPVIRPAGKGISVDATGKLANLLVRVPDGVDLNVNSHTGNVNVTDITGNIDVQAGTGDIKIMVPGYAQASTQNGNVEVTIGATHWPGTLRISSDDGDVTVYVPETASFHAHLHTDDGVLFTDFNLRGTSQGANETIDAPVNGGHTFGLDLESKKGAVRLLRLAPQA